MSIDLTNMNILQQSKNWGMLGRFNPKTGTGLFDRLQWSGEDFFIRALSNSNENMAQVKTNDEDTDYSVDYDQWLDDETVKTFAAKPIVIVQNVPLQLSHNDEFMNRMRASMDVELKLAVEQMILYGQSSEGGVTDPIRGLLAEYEDTNSLVVRGSGSSYADINAFIADTNREPLFSRDGTPDLLYTDATYPGTPEMISYDPFIGKWSKALNLGQYYDADDMVVRMNADSVRLHNGTKLLGAYFNPTAIYMLGDGKITEDIRYFYDKNTARIERMIRVGGAFTYMDSVRALVNNPALAVSIN